MAPTPQGGAPRGHEGRGAGDRCGRMHGQEGPAGRQSCVTGGSTRPGRPWTPIFSRRPPGRPPRVGVPHLHVSQARPEAQPAGGLAASGAATGGGAHGPPGCGACGPLGGPALCTARWTVRGDRSRPRPCPLLSPRRGSRHRLAEVTSSWPGRVTGGRAVLRTHAPVLCPAQVTHRGLSLISSFCTKLPGLVAGDPDTGHSCRAGTLVPSAPCPSPGQRSLTHRLCRLDGLGLRPGGAGEVGRATTRGALWAF